MSSGLFVKKPVEVLLAECEAHNPLKRSLGAKSLVALGIGAIIGAGIFTLTGVAAATHSGPAMVYSFLLAAFGCAFAGICYSEFSTMIPIAGSAYTYSYATLGELIAWIIGWALVLEYAVGAATVAVSWAATFDSILLSFGIEMPRAIVASPFAPQPGSVNLIAVIILCIISFILIRGISESARVNDIIVVIKVAVVILFIGIGYFFINRQNYHPFLPANTGQFGAFGWSGVLAGAGQVFFAYIGFDAVSTAAQEAKNPKRDMPIGIIGSLLICTVLYILYSLVLTGIVNYKELNVAAPLAVAVDRMKGVAWVGFLMKLGSLCGLTSVMLVMLLGQSRVFYSMSKDGLLPKLFSDLHPRFRTPWKSNLLLMVFVSLGAAFTPIARLGNLTSIGTLFAFVVACIGIIIMRRIRPDLPRPFKTPLVPLVPIVGVIANLGLMAGLGVITWAAFLIWMSIGLIVYFSYSRKTSVLQLTGRFSPTASS
ncbi:MAG TPA: amino acid permease [Bryobacteraceae bacterium]|jgi:APA family basic amino acid/polyamine antiporter|nr:amino acid permease [Bryobacteraceae bacterium]